MGLVGEFLLQDLYEVSAGTMGLWERAEVTYFAKVGVRAVS